jgi:hypothetical protein
MVTAPPRFSPQVIWPEHSSLVDRTDAIATDLGAWVARRPDWPTPRRDHMYAVPDNPTLAATGSGLVTERQPWEAHGGPTPEGRHRHRRLVLAFRSTPSSPGHYLARALTRAGVEVRVVDRVDLADHHDVDAIVVVESPTPPIEFVGSSSTPVVFWVHHGEHHIDGNVRLARRYGADLVLLAHSWHLALRFPGAVERFPFGVAPELARPFDGVRPVDLAFVGSLDGPAYERRRALLDDARAALEHVEVVQGISPVGMADLYGRSKAVLNEGGTRHRPITMRIFETVGAGALVVTDRPPGLDLLFGGGYLGIGEEGLDTDMLRSMLSDGTGAVVAGDAHRRGLDAHTYDHRVDLLFRFIDRCDGHGAEQAPAEQGPIAAFLADHPYGQRILDMSGSLEAPDREVWRLQDLPGEPAPGSFDTVVLDRASDPALAACARRFVVGTGIDPDALPVVPRSVQRAGDLVIIDVGGAGYDVATVGGPPAIA